MRVQYVDLNTVADWQTDDGEMGNAWILYGCQILITAKNGEINMIDGLLYIKI